MINLIDGNFSAFAFLKVSFNQLARTKVSYFRWRGLTPVK